MQASYGLPDNLRAVPAKPRNLRAPIDLVAFKRKLVKQPGAIVMAAPDEQITALGRQICECIDGDEALSRRAAIIQSVPDCGRRPVSRPAQARHRPVLLGHPALCRPVRPLLRRQFEPAQHPWGHTHPRNLPFMAAVSAMRCQPACQAL